MCHNVFMLSIIMPNDMAPFANVPPPFSFLSLKYFSIF